MRRSTIRASAVVVRAVACLTVLGAAASLGACDPCAGTVSCRGEPRLSASGQLVERPTGRPVAGVRVEIVPAEAPGAATFAPIVATTDADGFWRAAGPAPEGDLVVDVVVTPPAPRRAYRARGLRMRATGDRGDGYVAGRWVVDPYVEFLAEVRNRLNGTLISDARVQIRPVSGIVGAPPVTSTTSDKDGRVLVQVVPDDVAEVVVDVVIAVAGLSQGTVFRTRLPVQYRDEPVRVGGAFQLGIWLTYTGEIYFRGTGALLANTNVTFRRTGGIFINPPQLTTRSDATGHFLLAPQPAAEGEVVGELSFVPPGSARTVVIPNVRLTTYDSLETRLLRVGYGEWLGLVGELQLRGTFARAVGVPVEFRRTGGLAITPSVIASTTDAFGRFPLIATTLDSGEVVGDLVIDPNGPRREVYSGVRLRTFAADETRLARVWTVGDALFHAGELFERGSGRRTAGVDVRIVRRSGVAITPDTIVARTDAAGRFLIAASAAAPGEVVVDIEASTPGGGLTRIAGVRLATRRDEALPLAGVWGFGPSLLYSGEVLVAGTDRPVVGARVTFERTGGVETTPTRVDAVTDAGGRFPIHLVTRQAGEVIGTLTIRPPAPWPAAPIVIPNVRASTFDGDEQRLLAVWRIPPA